MINGYLFQKCIDRFYQGVEGDNWYLNDKYPDRLGTFFSEYVEKSWFEAQYVDVCIDSDFIEAYLSLSKLEKIKFRMILCETDKIHPSISEVRWKVKFIGYDYAYLGGSYYSAVLNDLILRQIDCFSPYHLNKYGLFDKESDIDKFVQERNEYLSKSIDMRIERGDFAKYRLSEVIFDA